MILWFESPFLVGANRVQLGAIWIEPVDFINRIDAFDSLFCE